VPGTPSSDGVTPFAFRFALPCAIVRRGSRLLGILEMPKERPKIELESLLVQPNGHFEVPRVCTESLHVVPGRVLFVEELNVPVQEPFSLYEL
jgi:hypothetical protein